MGFIPFSRAIYFLKGHLPRFFNVHPKSVQQASRLGPGRSKFACGEVGLAAEMSHEAQNFGAGNNKRAVWVWLRIQEPGLRRCSSLVPFTKVPF